MIDAASAVAAIFATWPAAGLGTAGGFTVRRSEGGGNRASAATLDAPPGDIDAAVSAMLAWGQRPIFRVLPDEYALDADLAVRGYEAYDHTLVLAAPSAPLAGADVERAILGDVPLRVMADVWAEGGLGPDRLAVMARVQGPKAYLLGRGGDRVAGAGFVARHGDAAVLHAVQVAASARRSGIASAMVRAAATWALAQGAPVLLLAVTRANQAGLGLYRRLGFAEAAAYHYRRGPP